MNEFKFTAVLFGLLFAVVLSCGGAIYAFWNYVAASVFGAPSIDYSQSVAAFGLIIFALGQGLVLWQRRHHE